MSPPKRGTPPPAWRSPGSAGRGSGVVLPGHAPSDARHVSYNDSIVHEVLETVAGALRGVDRGGAHGGRSVPPQESHSLSWQVGMSQEREASLLLAGRGQGSQAASGVTPALDGDG